MIRTVTLTAKPSDTPCVQCDGEGEAYVLCGFDDHGTWQRCPWCHGTGRELLPIPVAAMLEFAESARPSKAPSEAKS